MIIKYKMNNNKRKTKKITIIKIINIITNIIKIINIIKKVIIINQDQKIIKIKIKILSNSSLKYYIKKRKHNNFIRLNKNLWILQD